MIHKGLGLSEHPAMMEAGVHEALPTSEDLEVDSD